MAYRRREKPDPISLRAICVFVLAVFSDFFFLPFFISRINVELESPRLESLPSVLGGDEDISAGSFFIHVSLDSAINVHFSCQRLPGGNMIPIRIEEVDLVQILRYVD